MTAYDTFTDAGDAPANPAELPPDNLFFQHRISISP